MANKTFSNQFTFVLDREGEEYCIEIARLMMSLFHITEEEAVGRINNSFKNQQIVGIYDFVYHELPDFWAKTIYYGSDVFWWIEGQKLQPAKYP